MSFRAGLDHQKVVTAAAELIDSRGTDALALATLAAHLGVRTPSLYNHVPGLPALRRDLALLGLSELSACIAQSAVGKAADVAVLAMAVAYRDFAHRRPGLYAATLLWSDLRDTIFQTAGRQIVDIILAVLGAYGLHDEQAIHAVRGLRSMLHGFVSLEAAHGFGLPLDLDVSFHQLVEIYIRGLHYLLPEPG